MKRRSFLKTAAVGAVAAPFRLSADPPAADPRDRIGCTTVTFRHRFASTRPQGLAPTGPDFRLLDVPAMFVEELGLHNVELWSRHFPTATVAFGEELRAAAARAGARVVNLQHDEPPFDLSSSDPAKRRASIATVEHWMDIAAACGATSLRANVGGRPDEAFALGTTADSFTRLAAKGEKVGVRILVENHGGHSSKAENIAAIVAAVNSPWCRSLPDFGNMPAGFTPPQRVAFLDQILPSAHLVSAKGMEFDADYRHTSYDIAACVSAAEKSGFKGVYSIELWAPAYVPPDPFRAVRALTDLIARHL